MIREIWEVIKPLVANIKLFLIKMNKLAMIELNLTTEFIAQKNHRAWAR